LAIAEGRSKAVIYSIVGTMKKMAIHSAGLNYEQFFNLFELFKDAPFDELHGKTPANCTLNSEMAQRAKDPQVFIHDFEAAIEHYIDYGATDYHSARRALHD